MSTSVHHAKPDDTLRHIHSTMRLTGTRHMPVVDADKLVGMISDRDVHLAWSKGQDTPAIEIMRPAPRWVHPETPAIDAADIMLNRKIGSLPVIDEQRRLVGIVTETDFLQLVRRALVIQGIAAG